MKDEDEPLPPPGVTLRDPDDVVALRKSMEDAVQNSFRKYVHGYSYGGVRLELDNIHLADKESYTLQEQNEAKMKDKFLARRLRADVKLVDDTTNEVLDSRKKFTLARVPYLTDDRGTIIHNGSEYTPIHQMRLLPGVYSRKTQTGELESHFNTRPGTGPVMRVRFNPESAQYSVEIGKSNLHAYSFFRGIGVTDEELERRWGKQILDLNKTRFDKNAVSRAYTRVVPKWERDDSLDDAQKAEAIKKAIASAQIAESVMRRNLPNLFDAEKTASWRAVNIMFSQEDEMEKEASVFFSPDLTPAAAQDSILEFDFDSETTMTKIAAEGFEPDLTAEEMREAVNSIYGGRGPRLASMKSWPAKWLDDQDNMGWLQWYEAYANGRRSDTDERQIQRWKAFKRRHGAQFILNPTPRRGFALRNWAIDPLRLLPAEKKDQFAEEMRRYKDREHAKWILRKGVGDDKLMARARERGFSGDNLVLAAEEGFIGAKDVMDFA